MASNTVIFRDIINTRKGQPLVYGLLCPLDLKVKYIGFTTNIRKRYLHHYGLKNTTTSLGRWIVNLRAQNLCPIPVALVINGTRRDERMLIRKFKNQLFNKQSLKVSFAENHFNYMKSQNISS